MAVKMRLMRMGKKKQPQYRVVVIDGRAQRDGRYIEQIGRYAPLEDPSLVEIDNEKAAEWLAKGAQPTEAVEKLLNISGAMNTMKVRTGQIHTVGTPVPPSAEEVADDEAVGDAAGEASEEAAAEEVPAEEVSVEEVAVEEVPAEEVAVEEVPAEEVAVEEVPAEEVSLEEVPAEVSTEAADTDEAAEDAGGEEE